MPTDRLPCPAVVSYTPTKPIAPVSMLLRGCELAPLVGSVWWPKCPKAYRWLFVPGEPSVTLCSATVLSPVTRTIPASCRTVLVSADCVTHCADMTVALFVRVTSTV
jgi:hypothetical protein